MTEARPVRADGTLTPQGLKRVEEMAAKGRSQGTIAAFLGVPKREFESMMAKGKGNNPIRLAWESGNASREQELADRMWNAAMGTIVEEYIEEPKLDDDGKPVLDDKNEPVLEKVKVRTITVSKSQTIEAIFLAKSRFGWKEGDQSDKGGTNVILTLPKARTREEYFAMLGIPDPKALAGALKVVQQVALDPKALAPPAAKP